MDETASKRGHNYISLFVDLERLKVLFATEGKDAEAVMAFRRDLEQHGGKAEQIQEVCMDMSPAFIQGVLEGINSLVQAARARARGYRSTRNFITMESHAGKLDRGYPFKRSKDS